MILRFLQKLFSYVLRKSPEGPHDFLRLEYSKAKPLGEYQQEDNLISERAS